MTNSPPASAGSDIEEELVEHAENNTTPLGMVSGERSFAPTDEYDQVTGASLTGDEEAEVDHLVATFLSGTVAVRAEGNWSRADGVGTSRNGGLTFAATGNVTSAQQAGDPKLWKPMSAAKLRAAAKQDEYENKRRGREAKANARVDANAAVWQEAFDTDQPLSLEEAASRYAEWVSSGRQGEDAKETVFEACKGYKYRIGGPGRCRKGWVLKTGALGFGYYKDGVPEQQAKDLHELLWPTERLAPVVVCLDEVVSHRKVIGDPLVATSEDHVEEAPKEGKKRKQKKNSFRKGQGDDSG